MKWGEFGNRKNFVGLFLLAGIAFSVVRIIGAAPPDPGHSWSEIDVTASNPLPVSRGGTGTTTLTANAVILGNGTGAVGFVAPGTSGNVLTSDGTTWQSSALTQMVLLYSDETDSSEIGSSVTETNLKSWVMNVTPGNYAYYILEAEVTGNDGRNVNSNATFTWRFNEAGNLKKSFVWRTLSTNLASVTNGHRFAATLKTIINNSLPANANLKLTGQMSNSDASFTMQAHSFRVYGVK